MLTFNLVNITVVINTTDQQFMNLISSAVFIFPHVKCLFLFKLLTMLECFYQFFILTMLTFCILFICYVITFKLTWVVFTKGNITK